MPHLLFVAAFSAALLGSGAGGMAETVWDEMAEDGTITVQEVRRNAGRAFSAIDRNDDGVISRTEFQVQRLPANTGLPGRGQPERDKLFDLIDKSGDEVVTTGEWEAALQRNVTLADGNGDGRVTLKELAEVDVGTVLRNLFGF